MTPLRNLLCLAALVLGLWRAVDGAVVAPAAPTVPAPAMPAPAVPAPAMPAPAVPAPAWRAVGWGGGAFYYATAWNPTADGVIYLGGDCCGAYRSQDQGRHWTFADQGMRNYAVFSLAVSPAAPDLVYAMTEGGLQKSADQGRHWTFIPASGVGKLGICAGKWASVQAVAIDPHHPDTVYAGSRTGKLFKTRDGGATWQELPYRNALSASAAGPAYHGSGALVLTYASAKAGVDTVGRVDRTYGAGPAAKDWSTFKKLSVRFREPADAPVLQAGLAVQCGDSWLWQQGPWVDGRPGAWTEVDLDLGALKAMNAVHMVHVMVRSPHAPWHGELLLDALALSMASDGALAPDQVPDGKATVLLDDWETAGDSEGWVANRQYADSPDITAVRESLGGARTTDGGAVSSVAVGSGDPGPVYVSNTVDGAFRSDDGGTTWTSLPTPKQVKDVTTPSDDPQVVWAACGKDGLRRSADRGSSWTAISAPVLAGVDMLEVALPPGRPGLVYAIGNIGWGGFLFRSDDGGGTWSRSNMVRTGIPGDPTLPKEGTGPAKTLSTLSTVTNIAVNPQHPDELFISANWRNAFSADGGRTLEERSTGADNTCATDIQFLGGKTYVTAMDEGLMVSDDDGATWRQLIPLKYDPDISGHFWRVRVARHGDSVRIVTTCSPWKSFGDPGCANRVFVSDDDGRTFSLSLAGLPAHVPDVNCMWGRSFPRALAADPGNPQVFYLGMDGAPQAAKKRQGGGVFRSADGGRTWTRCPGQPGSRRMFYGLAVDPTDSRRLFWSCCGDGGGVWRSEDAGATWTHVFTGDTWSFNLEITPSGAVLVGEGDLYRSRDHGATWTRLTTFSGDGSVIGIAVDPADARRIWISRTTWDSSDHGGVYRSTDDGATWQDITGDIPYRKPQILRYDPGTRELWAGGVGLFSLQQ